ncbi:MAG: GIY-YIG nuclease family protein [Pseudomonadota bacterium]
MITFYDRIDDDVLAHLPKTTGAYVLVIELAHDLMLQNKRFAGITLRKGTYLYCGSAKGPGGIAARVKRHCRAEKKPHWHVDDLTANGAGRVSAAWIVPGGNECALREKGASIPGVSIPVPGFGSSDCNICQSHLLRWEGDVASFPVSGFQVCASD